MKNLYSVDEMIRETYCAIQRTEIYLVDSAICLLHDWDHIDNDDQAMVSDIKHSVSNPLRELNNYDKATYIIYSLFLELWQKQAGKEVLTIIKKGYLGRSILYLLIGFFEEKSEPPILKPVILRGGRFLSSASKIILLIIWLICEKVLEEFLSMLIKTEFHWYNLLSSWLLNYSPGVSS